MINFLTIRSETLTTMKERKNTRKKEVHYLDKIIETINHCSDRIKCETFNYTFNHLPTSYFPFSNAHEASIRSEFEDFFILYLDCKSNTHRNGFKNRDNINFNLQLC